MKTPFKFTLLAGLFICLPVQAAKDGYGIDMVKLPSGLMMGKYEVTQGQWRAVMNRSPSKFSVCGDNCPVNMVSWDDIQVFIQRLNSQTGKHFRLPTEDEWYSACQAGSYDSEYCGSNNIDLVAWYDGNSGDTIHVVGQKQPNAYGLYDMSGNVSEWTSTCFDSDCSQRMIRGGAWLSWLSVVHSDLRRRDKPSFRNTDLGFRLAQDP